MSIASLQLRAWDGHNRRRGADEDYSGRERRNRNSKSKGQTMGSESVSAQEFGLMQGQMQAMRADMEQMIVSINALQLQMGELQRTLTEARGGWRLLMGLGGAVAGIVVGLVGAWSWIAAHIKFTP